MTASGGAAGRRSSDGRRWKWTIEDKFWNQAIVPDSPEDCWGWEGTFFHNGYPKLVHERRVLRAHRYACTLLNGPCPPGLQARHLCHRRDCVNPNHLIWGTAKANSTDMVQSGRSLKGERQPNTKLTEEQVLEIYHSTDKGATLSKKYKVSPSRISSIRSGKAWAWLTTPTQ